MAGISRRSSSASLAPPPVPSSTSLAKRPATENAGKVSQALQQQAKKRVALRNLSNQSNVGRNPVRPTATKVKHKGKATTTVSSLKKGEDIQVSDVGFHGNPQIVSSAIKPSTQTSCMDGVHGNPQIVSSAIKPSTQTSCMDGVPALNDGSTHGVRAPLAPCSNNVPSPSESAGCSVSVDETMSTCDSMKSPDIEYIDNVDSSQVASLERQASENLSISENSDAAGHKWKRNVLMGIEVLDVVDVDIDYDNPQMCATLACDIYNHLRLAETKKRPSTDFMEVIQKDINASMRAILIDWLVEVAEEYRLVPDTLYLTVNYIDRYLSGNEMDRQHLQLLGVGCMLIAAKYEEICAPQVEEFCFITDNTYVKEEVLQMEAAVLRYLKFEMTAPTAKCFLRRFVRAAQHSDEAPLLQLEFLANYLAELSLLEYSFLCYTSSLIAASAIFLAKFILLPTKTPWNATLRHYTLYQPSELCGCVKALHRLFCNSAGSSLPAIREKYSQHKYKFVAKKYCPPSIPSDYFQDVDG